MPDSKVMPDSDKSVASQEDKYIFRMPKSDYTPDSRGLGYVLYECMSKNKNKLAQIYGPTGEEDSFGKLLQRCVRTAIAMKKSGLKPGDYVSLCTFNHLNSCTPVIASSFMGAITAAVDPTLSQEDTVHLLKQVTPKLIFVIPEAVQMIEKVIKEISSDTKIVLFGETTKHTPFSEFLLPDDEEDNFKPFEAKDLRDIVTIFFSSGTSGLPKGVCHNHYSILCQNDNFINRGFCFDLTLAYASPYWTIFPMFLFASLTTGTARLVYPRFDPNMAWKIFDYKLTLVLLNTIQVLTMLNLGRPKGLNISSLKEILIGGSGLMSDQMLKVKEVFHDTKVYVAYGLSEISGPLLIVKPRCPKEVEVMARKPTSAGSGMPGTAYKVVDPETEEILGPNQEGELRVKTDAQLTGYHNMDSSGIWDSDGYLKTGDVARYDEDGYFYIVDRIKEMFKFQCWHIAPAVLEGVLLTHPGIAMAVVIGKPHQLDDNHPMGIVVLKPSHQNLTSQDIVKYMDERVQDRQRLRAGVKIVDSLPITASGKIDRKKIKTMF